MCGFFEILKNAKLLNLFEVIEFLLEVQTLTYCSYSKFRCTKQLKICLLQKVSSKALFFRANYNLGGYIMDLIRY